MNKDGTPKGGKWSFDEDNRKNYQTQSQFQNHLNLKHNTYRKFEKFIEINFKSHPGFTNRFWFPTTRDQGNKALDDFLKNKINLFGDYEDAVSKKSNILFHSALSPLINIGLITPMEILEKLKKFKIKLKLIL